MKKYSKIKRENIGEYVLFSNEKGTKNVVSFKDGQGKRKILRINEKMREEYKKQKSEINIHNIKYSRYIEHSNLSDYMLNERAVHKIKSAEDEALEKLGEMRIIQEIWNLPDPQNRRVYMYLVEGLSNKEISEIEGRDHSVISKSISAGIKKLQKKLKNF